MARKKPPEPPPVEVKQFTRPEIDRGREKIKRRIEDVRRLETDHVRWDDARVDTTERNIRETIREIFGQRSPEFRDLEYHRIDRGGNFIGGSDAEYQHCFLEGIPYTITLLEGLISGLEEKAADLESWSVHSHAAVGVPTGPNRRVFVVHGHDEAVKEAVARFLSKLYLEPIILHEQPNAGRTIIEKFEAYADVGFAVVLLTPDDLGAPADKPGNAQLRARQNVIFELGFFLGRLGRSSVCALYKGDLELLSDYQGVLYVPIDAAGGWRLALAREINPNVA